MKFPLALAAVLIVTSATSGAEARRTKKAKPAAKPAAKAVNIDAFRDKLVVLKSAVDTYIAFAPGKSIEFWFGTAAAMYQQKNRGGGGTVEKGYAYFWEPRIGKGYRASGNYYRHRLGKVTFKDSIGTLECGKRTTAFMVLPPDKTDAFLAKAKFFERRWKRQAFALARDSKGRYYYVDKLVRQHGDQGFRVFVGYRGKLKRTRLKNIALDSAGAVFFTRNGEFRLVTSKSSTESYWVRRGKESKLLLLPPMRNRYLIYTGLGVYDGIRLGTPCDDH